MAVESHWHLHWADRPSEEARLLNPAFCAELVLRTGTAYHKAQSSPLGLTLAFVVLPLTLHKPTRDALPGNAGAAFAGWVADKNALLAELPGRIIRLRSITREALLFALQHNALSIAEGGLVPVKKSWSFSSQGVPSSEETSQIRDAAALLGRWFANQGSQVGILQGLGVTP